MKAKSFFKGPGIWIVVVVGLLLVAFATLAPGGSTRIDTKDGLELLSQSGKVEQAKIFDAENRVDLVLKDNLNLDGQDKGKNVQFFYVTDRGPDVVKAVTNANPDKGFTDQPVENNWFSGLFSLLIPRAAARCPVLVPAFPHAGWRLQGDAVRQVQGKAGQQGHAPPGDLLRRRRC